MDKKKLLDLWYLLFYTFPIELEYTYWKSKDGWFVGYLNIWPEHLTQGHDLTELEEMLTDLYEFYKEEQEMKIEKKTGKLKVTA